MGIGLSSETVRQLWPRIHARRIANRSSGMVDWAIPLTRPRDRQTESLGKDP